MKNDTSVCDRILVNYVHDEYGNLDKKGFLFNDRKVTSLKFAFECFGHYGCKKNYNIITTENAEFLNQESLKNVSYIDLNFVTFPDTRDFLKFLKYFPYLRELHTCDLAISSEENCDQNEIRQLELNLENLSIRNAYSCYKTFFQLNIQVKNLYIDFSSRGHNKYKSVDGFGPLFCSQKNLVNLGIKFLIYPKDGFHSFFRAMTDNTKHLKTIKGFSLNLLSESYFTPEFCEILHEFLHSHRSIQKFEWICKVMPEKVKNLILKEFKISKLFASPDSEIYKLITDPNCKKISLEQKRNIWSDISSSLYKIQEAGRIKSGSIAEILDLIFMW